MLGDEVDRHIGVKPGEVGLELPETWSFAELVRLFGEEAFLVRNEHARPQPFEGRETLVETIGRRPRRIADVAPTAEMPFADMRGLVAILLEQRSEEHTSELQSLMRISYAVFCLKKKKNKR